MALNKNVRPIYLYPPTHKRLLAVQERMREAQGGRQVTIDQVVEKLLDLAAEREDQGA